jgi:hypothetical protein
MGLVGDSGHIADRVGGIGPAAIWRMVEHLGKQQRTLAKPEKRSRDGRRASRGAVGGWQTRRWRVRALYGLQLGRRRSANTRLYAVD